ncbi:two-component system sensor histidine kinase KdpD [Massilia agilis]|uniref:histidine kinase n=1 Tax=Massilia agilis TaxID=1811226 RepID=A0ABT2D644_9BURK|nr:two-component system sensor histidine kinase KdpD [Massilia agilis]MCS0806780.1 two-component system sensor histidine kinase KdpD [Massilia agilis]
MILPTDEQRRDPDAWLAQVQAQERRAARGKLRVYFGASAGVGKTYAMLLAARELQAAGRTVLVGVVETHGRAETESLLKGLEVLPRKTVDYRGKALTEFDIDTALQRHPELVLVDELAHSNVPGSRHPKRWQDIEELLDAGIDVFTTVNVQHLESLNDVVGGITGVRVSETVPDTVFDAANEVVLVDLPADELLARLKMGKVYQAPQAERATLNFFRKGNLIALRELALRRTADRIEDDVRAYRVEKSIDTVWKTGCALLACIGPGADAERVVRSAARLAGQLGADWHAVYVETPALQRLPAAAREATLKALKLAQELGAITAVLPGAEFAVAAVEYARSHNLSKIAIGRDPRAWPWRQARSRSFARLAPDIDLIEVAESNDSGAAVAPPRRLAVIGSHQRKLDHLWAALAALGMALAATPTIAYLDLANIAMLFLLVVLLVAVRWGRGPSVTATCVGVACFDFFFVQPRFTFAISDFQYLVTFTVMLAVGLITGHLTAGLRFQARVASQREARVRALYEFARALSGVLQTEQIHEATRETIQSSFGARTVLLLPDAEGRLQLASAEDVAVAVDLGIAQWAYDHATNAGMGTDTLPASGVFYLPLIAPMRTRGVLALESDEPRWLLVPELRRQLDTFGALAAIALERVHYIDVAQDALIRIESERLRNSLLAALSHDLRTPLTSLVALAESLAVSAPSLSEQQRQMTQALRDEATRMSTMVSNLLDMARIQSGEVKLNLQWQPIEEVVGSALRACRFALSGHQVVTRVPADLPLVRFDAVLIERVLCNLLENAGKYTPPGSTLTLSAQLHGVWLNILVEDNGPGLPPGQEEAIFEKFTRGERESAKPGVGLGLAICRAIVEAHGGTIGASARPEGGAAFLFTLPLGMPPAMPALDDELENEEEREEERD